MMRHIRFLVLFMVGLVWAGSSSAQTSLFTPVWHCTNLVGSIPAANAFCSLTFNAPIWGNTNATLIPVPVNGMTDSNGVVSFTNTASGYSYVFEIDVRSANPYQPITRVKVTNGFPVGLTGVVSAEPFNGYQPPGNVPFAYFNTNQPSASLSPLVTDINAASHSITNASAVQAPNLIGSATSATNIVSSNLIPPGAVYTNVNAGTEIDGLPGYAIPVDPAKIYFVGITDAADQNGAWNDDTQENFEVPGGYISGGGGVIYVYEGDGNTNELGHPVTEQVYALQTAVYAQNVHSTNLSGTFSGDANVNNLTVANPINDQRLTNSSGFPINGVGLKEPANLMSVGSRLLPRLLSGTPPVFCSMGDSMADDSGGFNGTAFYLENQLRYMFGNAGKKLAYITANGTISSRWPNTPSANGWSVAGGAIIYGSDGTNAASSTAPAILKCNSGGFWALAWTNAGTVYATVTGSGGVTSTITVNLFATNQLANAILFHTNISFTSCSNVVWNFTATSGSNYILGADYFQTSGGGIITAPWNRGGYTITNVFWGMGTNNTYTLMSGINPDILMIHCRNNGQEAQTTISNELNVTAVAAVHANSECSVVLVYSPQPPGFTPSPVSLTADINLAATGVPFYAFDLYDCFRNSGDIAVFGWNAHPLAAGGQLAAKIAYDAMGFGFNHGYTNATDGTTILPAASYNQTH